jgi:hypothetical protein
MGLFLTLIGLSLIASLVITIFVDKDFAPAILAMPIMVALLGAAIILGYSMKSFEREELTKIDATVEVFETKSSSGSVDCLFEDPGTNTYFKVDHAKFDEIQSFGNKMMVRRIARETPRTFWRFRSSSSKLILIVPENKQ